MEGSVHKRLKIVALAFLKKYCTDIVANEVKFWNMKSKADAVGINLQREEIRIIEVKASKQDYKRDKKLFSLAKSYFPHGTYFYIMCPTDIIKKEDVLPEIGLIYVDENNNYEIIQNPKKNLVLRTQFITTLRRTVRAMTNDLMFRFHHIEDIVPGFNKDFTKKHKVRKRKKKP